MTTLRQRFYENYLKRFLKGAKQSVRTFIMATKQQVGLSSSTKTEAASGLHVQKPSIVLVALNLFHRLLCVCVRFVLVKVHGEHGQSMPPIEDLLLLESATSIAEKIRNKKVKRNKFDRKLNRFIKCVFCVTHR